MVVWMGHSYITMAVCNESESLLNEIQVICGRIAQQTCEILVVITRVGHLIIDEDDCPTRAHDARTEGHCACAVRIAAVDVHAAPVIVFNWRSTNLSSKYQLQVSPWCNMRQAVLILSLRSCMLSRTCSGPTKSVATSPPISLGALAANLTRRSLQRLEKQYLSNSATMRPLDVLSPFGSNSLSIDTIS